MATATGNSVGVGTGQGFTKSGTAALYLTYAIASGDAAYTVSVSKYEVQANVPYNAPTVGGFSVRTGTIKVEVLENGSVVASQSWDRPASGGWSSTTSSSVPYSANVSHSFSAPRGHVARQIRVTATGTFSGGGSVNLGTSTATATSALPAKASYTVTLNGNGASLSQTSLTKWYGENLALPQPTREGYTFKGWSVDSSPNTALITYSPGVPYTGNAAITLYAVWQAIVYSIRYDGNGGTLTPMLSMGQAKPYGEPVVLASDSPTWAQHKFLGWATSQNGAPVYQPGDTYTADASVTLYAVWELLWDMSVFVSRSYRTNAQGYESDTGEYVTIRGGVNLSGSMLGNLRTTVDVYSLATDGRELVGPSSSVENGDVVPTSGTYTYLWESGSDAPLFLPDEQYTFQVECNLYGPSESATNMAVNFVTPYHILYGDEPTVLRQTPAPGSVLSNLQPVDDYEGDTDPNSCYAVRTYGIEGDEVVLTLDSPAERPAALSHQLRIELVAKGFKIETTTGPDGSPGMIMVPYEEYVTIYDDTAPEYMYYGDDPYVWEYEITDDDMAGLNGHEPTSIIVKNTYGGSNLIIGQLFAPLDYEIDGRNVTATVSYPEEVYLDVPIQWRKYTVDADGTAMDELLATKTAVTTVTKGEFILDFHRDGKGMGIGDIAPEEGLTVGWNTEFKKGVKIGTGVNINTNCWSETDPSAQVLTNPVLFSGKEFSDSHHVGFVRARHEANGTIGLGLFLKHVTNGETTYYNGFEMAVDANGNKSYSWNDQAAARASLGLGYLDGNGNVTNKTLTFNGGHKIVRPVYGTSWISGRDGALVRVTTSTTNSWDAILSSKTPSASWEIGTLGENLYFSYATDANYNANNNTTKTIKFTVTENNYTGLETSDRYLRAPSSGLLPYKSGGAGNCGTDSWPWAVVATNSVHIGGHVLSAQYVYRLAYSVNLQSGNLATQGTASISGTVAISGSVLDYTFAIAGIANGIISGTSISRSGNNLTVTATLRNIRNATASVIATVRIFARVWGCAAA